MQSNEFSPEQVDRIIQMAWEDRTTFDAIKLQFGLTQGEVVHLMRKTLNRRSLMSWRKRIGGRKTKHVERRGYEIGRFRALRQRG